MSMDDLAYVEVYCTDLKLYGVFNKAYASTLKSPYPARDFIGVKDLLFGAHFEVMGIAVRNASQKKHSRSPLNNSKSCIRIVSSTLQEVIESLKYL
jgi:hypothetical protein